METSASCEARSAPSLYPTVGPKKTDGRRPVSRGMRYASNVRRARSTMKRRPAMKKISTVRVNGNMIFKGHKLTIGVDLGDRELVSFENHVSIYPNSANLFHCRSPFHCAS